MSQDFDADTIMNKILEKKLPTINEIEWLNNEAKKIFEQLPNVVSIQAPVTICGDIHGQFTDLMELFEIGGKIPYTNYLFLGDYVDRGAQSVETVTYLFCLKIKYPNHITLIRGNHESSNISQLFGFRDEVLGKYNGNEQVWKIYTSTFNYLPLGALVNGKVLFVHCGLSPTRQTIPDIQDLNRKTEIPHKGPMCDLVWSDPSQNDGFMPSCRDAGYQFGRDVTSKWNKDNGLELTCRGHQLAMQGIEYNHDNQIVTVFSAPDYCGRCGNSGGILELDENLARKDIRFKTPSVPIEIPTYFDFDLSEYV